jgi:hypothetical protein
VLERRVDVGLAAVLLLGFEELAQHVVVALFERFRCLLGFAFPYFGAVGYVFGWIEKFGIMQILTGE